MQWKFEDQSQFFKVGIDAATLDSKQYGIPRMLCMKFMFTRDPKIAASNSYDELQENLAGKNIGYSFTRSSYDALNYFDHYLA